MWLSFKTWCSLSVPQCTASNKRNWNSWCLYKGLEEQQDYSCFLKGVFSFLLSNLLLCWKYNVIHRTCMYLFSRVIDAPKCPAETIQGIAWSITAQGGTDVQRCPSGARGKPFSIRLIHLLIQWAICKFSSASISKRVYMRSLCYENQFSFILRFELITIMITTILHSDSLWKRGWVELGNGLLRWVFLGIIHVAHFHESSWLCVVNRATFRIAVPKTTIKGNQLVIVREWGSCVLTIILGSATRECSIDATWKNPSFTGCNSPVFSMLQDEVRRTL